MKCGVCGNILKPEETKCSVCGTNYDSATKLSSAMSNISSLANALKAKRQESNTNTKSYDSELKKVVAIEEEMEKLYTKDIDLVVPEDEYEEDFDLNAFYEDAKLKANDTKTEIVEDESNGDNTNFDVDDAKDSLVEATYKGEQTEDNTVNIEDAEVDNVDNASDTEEDIVESDTESEEDETLEDELEADNLSETSEESNELSIDQEDVEDTKEDVEEEKFESIDLDNFDSNNDNAVVTSGYIKESDIKLESEEEQEEDDDLLNIEEISAETASEPVPVAPAVVEAEDTSKFVDFDAPNTPNNLNEANNVATNSDSQVLGKIEPETIAVEQPQGEKGEFDPVKAEDVPYTQVDEVQGSKVSNDNPIVIDAKDVVGTSSTDDNQPPVEAKSSEELGKKPNRFFATMAKIMLVLSLLVFAILCANEFLLQDLENTNVVFEFITTFLSNTENLHYVVLGTLGADALAIIFSFLQLICVKKRKLGAIPLLLSIILAGAMAGLYYYLEFLLPAIDTLMAFFG